VIKMQKEIIIPENINVEIDGKSVKISGEKGQIERKFKYFFDIKIEKKDNKIVLSSDSDKRKVKATVGTVVAHIQNMFKGLTEGFTYKMKVIYSHFPVTVKIENNNILINNFLGEKVPRKAKILGNTKIDVQGQDITITGMNKEDVGQTCANIETACKITKFDRRVFMDGIYPV